MKTSSQLLKLCMMASLIIALPILGNKTEAYEAKCGVDPTPLQQSETSDEVSYISGGICLTGVQTMKDLAKDYALELVLVEKTDAYEKENYIADVMVTIKDVKEKIVLSASTEGPFLLVNLPDGQYQVTAEYNGVIKTKKVKVNNSKHKRVVFLWPQQLVNE